MGFLKNLKGAFIEEVPNENYEIPVDMTINEEEPMVEAELESVDTTTLINDIYAQNDLLDTSRSIFKVEELIASLPKEMVTETKKSSVLAILSSFNLTSIEVTEDGERRINILNNIKAKIDTDCQNVIADKEIQIEECKKAIETLTIEIANEHEKMKKSDEVITVETAKIENLIKFIRGEM